RIGKPTTGGYSRIVVPSAQPPRTRAARRRSDTAPVRRRRWPRRLGYAALALLLLVVALRLALPTLLERGGARAAPRYLGLPAHLENVDLALLRGQVVLEGLVVGSHPASTLGGRRLPAAPAGGDVPTAVQEEPAEARVEEQEVAAQEQEVEAQE